MKIKHLEYAKLVLLSTYIASKLVNMGDNVVLEEINEILIKNNLTIEEIQDYLCLAFNISVLAGFSLEQLCKDYERIETFYNVVVCNVAELIDAFDIQDDPIKVFALYTYLYRSGYLSVNKEFKYSVNMKDLPLLGGVDVVRGRGVCRSISSMFTDVCNSVGLTASNVCVRVKPSALQGKEDLSLRKLDVEQRGKKFAKLVGKVTSVVPIGNHLVTSIEHDSKTGIYDPTNDVFMHVVGARKYAFINDTSATMAYSFVSNLSPKILGQMNTQINVPYLKKLSMKDRIAYEEYLEIYHEMNKFIQDNEYIFDEFYKINLPYYNEIEKLTREQSGMIKRMFPIIPKKSLR